MKKLTKSFITLPLLVTLLSCCSGRYYYFDSYSVNEKVSSQSVSLTPTSTEQEIGHSFDVIDFCLSEEKTTKPLEEPEIAESFSNKEVHGKNIPLDTIKVKQEQNNRPNESSSQTGDRKKNGFAIGGFGAAMVIPLIVMITLGSGAGFWVTIPVWLIGFIFSSLGLKSKKRKLAKTAFWILVVMGIVGIFGFLYFGLTLKGFGSMNLF